MNSPTVRRSADTFVSIPAIAVGVALLTAKLFPATLFPRAGFDGAWAPALFSVCAVAWWSRRIRLEGSSHDASPGLGLAAWAACAHAVADLPKWMLLSARTSTPQLPLRVLDLAEILRAASLFAFVFGLGLELVDTIGRRRLEGATPRWARGRDA